MSGLRSAVRQLAFRIPVLGQRYRDLWSAAVSHYQINPGHYGSPIPSLEEIERELSASPRVVADSLPGIPLRTTQQLALLKELKPLMGSHAFPAEADGHHRYHYRNDWFQYADGLVLHGMLRHFRPRRVIEVGSGYSSGVMLDTLAVDPSLKTSFTMIEPNCERLRSRLRVGDETEVRLIEGVIQDAPRQIFERLEANDILFIDSSHVVKCGGDVNVICHEILPELQSGVIVHFHDVFFPFTYPERLLRAHHYWSEAYLLRAFLCMNPSFEILLWNDYLRSTQPKSFADAMPAEVDNIACSFWMRRSGK